MRKHKRLGTPIDEWVNRVPNELLVDPVGLWQLVNAFKDGFGLSDVELEPYLRQCVVSLLDRGALPVQGNENSGWSVREDLATPQPESPGKIIAYWKLLGRDPDVGDLWFTLPKFIDERVKS